MTGMNDTYPTSAYDLLEDTERAAVDEYVQFAVEHQRSQHQRIIDALRMPIPSEYIRRSRQSLNKPLARAAIAERITEEASRSDLSADRALHEYAAVAFSDITDYLKAGYFGEPVIKDLRDIPASKAGAIKSIECKPGHMGTSWKLTLHDKLPALRTLSDLMGLTAPDRPPALADYVRGEIKDAEYKELTAPETEYNELLESVSRSKS